MKENESLAQSLEEALIRNNVESLAALVNKIDILSESDAEVERLSRDLFHLAVELGSVVGLRTLLSNPLIVSHVDVNELNVHGIAPAVEAVQADNVGALAILIDHGVDPFTCPLQSTSPRGTRPPLRRHSVGDGTSVFDTVCRDGRISCVQFLISLLAGSAETGGNRLKNRFSGIDGALVEKILYRALMSAIEHNQPEVVSILLHAGADAGVNLDNDIGTALHVCARYNSVECLDLIITRGAVIDVDGVATDRQQTALMIASQYSHIDIVQRLLANGADVNKQTKECSSSLILACHYGHKDCVDLLLAYGADAHLKNPWDYSALYMGTDMPEILQRLLLESVAEVNEKCGEREEVPLHLASVIGSVGTVRMLLDVGADIDRQTIYHENALWLAAWKDHEDVARLLIQNNIDLDIYSNGYQVYVWHYLPIELAIGLELYRLMKMLLIAGCRLHNDKYYTNTTFVDSSAQQLAENQGTVPAAIEQQPQQQQSHQQPQHQQQQPSTNGNQLVPHPGTACNLYWIRLRPEVFDYIKYNAVEFNWLMNFLTSPTSLKNAARRVVRRSLKKGQFQVKVERLPLPRIVKDYLMMDDLYQI